MNKNIIIILINKVKEFIIKKESSADIQGVQESFAVSIKSVILKDWKWWLFGAIFSFFLASILMSGWSAGISPNINYPYKYSGDSLFHSVMIQRTIEGGAFNNSRSGYPFGSNSLDFPNSDSGNFAILKLIGSVVGSWFGTFNLYFLLGFFITFIVSFCVLRLFSLSLSFAFTAAMLFNFLPFHFQRLGHLFYTWYFVIPIFWYLSLKVYSSWQSKMNINTTLRNIFYAVCLMWLGSFGIYYAVFGLIMLFFTTILTIINNYNLKIIKIFLFSSFFIIFGVFLNLFPTLINQYINGQNPQAVQRNIAQAEIYGFKFVQLLLPIGNHRITTLANISTTYSSETPLVNENANSSLGIVGSFGLLITLCIVFFNLFNKLQNNKLRFISLTVLVLVMFGTIGGFGSIFSQLITTSIRGWNRVSIFIGFGVFLILFLFLQALFQKYFTGRRFIIFSIIISVLLLSAGLYDQTAPACLACNEQIQKSFNMDKEFINSIEKSLPTGSAIYQLPYMPFPEAGIIYNLKDYDLFVGFLHSSSLNWSYGGMKGRNGDLFYQALAKESIEKQVEVIRNLGFAGIYIDKQGFVDDGKTVINSLTELLGVLSTITRADGKVVFFNLNQKNRVNLEGLSDEQIMQKAGYVSDHLGVRYNSTITEGIDFTRPDFPIFVKDIQGLSGLESWGRWSDSNLSPSIRIDLQEQLPNRFDLIFIAQSFGPNVGSNLKVKIGTQIHYFKLKADQFEYNKLIDLGGEKVSYIEFIPPQPTSPEQLNLSTDTRKLGIGLVHLSFKEK